MKQLSYKENLVLVLFLLYPKSGTEERGLERAENWKLLLEGSTIQDAIWILLPHQLSLLEVIQYNITLKAKFSLCFKVSMLKSDMVK